MLLLTLGDGDMLGEQLKKIALKRNLSIQQLAEMSEVPVETMKNLYYGRVKDPKVSTVLQISQALDVSVNYLMGDMFISDEERTLVSAYRKCGNHGKSIMQLIGRYESQVAKKEREAFDKHRVPCLVPVGHVYDGAKYSTCDVLEVYTDNKKAYLAVQLVNNCFAPVYCKDDKILLEDRYPRSGERAIFVQGDTVYLRQYIEGEGKYILKCLNGHGKDFEFKRMDTVQCLGTCIGIVRAD